MSINTYEFGVGNLFVTPTGTGPFTAAEPTPYELATLQEISIDMPQSQKELYGKLRAPVAIAATEMKPAGKAKFARFNAGVFNYLWGGAPSVGSQKVMALNTATGLPGEPQTPSAGTFTVTNASAFSADLGVYDTVTGLFMSKVLSGTPTAGQYKVTSGVYTVPSGDTNPKIVYYVYTLGGSVGVVSKIPNIPMGSNPQFSMYLYNNQWQGQNMLLELYQCASSKLTFGFKNTDWMVPEFDFYFMDNGTGYIGELHTDSIG